MQIIPTQTTVLVVGGGPGGSYAASCLAREGVNVVVLEAEVFPRYHIGESMLASLRHFLRFIDLEDDFDKHGFYRKNGAAFKLNKQKREGYTDFLATGGPKGYAWNVIRSEADELLFRHAGKSGANVFDGVKVDSIGFVSSKVRGGHERPVSASYTRQADKVSGVINFDYLIDASGRAGILSSKYLKNRKYNSALKNMAFWSYWRDTNSYGLGTSRADSPFFEALTDESGWAWLIPLHNGTTSVGIVMNQDVAAAKRKAGADNIQELDDFYQTSLALAPNLRKLLAGGSIVAKVRVASDYSYSATAYAVPYARIVGDAGCFIDPFFSSGVHLAMTGGLSAAATICASIRGQCTETAAADWHSTKVAESYRRFLVVVLSAYRQMRNQDEHVLSKYYEDNFDEAFDFIRPIIQGTADVTNRLSRKELTESLDFCAQAFEQTRPEHLASVVQKFSPKDQGGFAARGIKGLSAQGLQDTLSKFQEQLSDEEMRVLNQIRARKLMGTDTSGDWDSLTTDVIHGRKLVLKQGKLGIASVKLEVPGKRTGVWSSLGLLFFVMLTYSYWAWTWRLGISYF